MKKILFILLIFTQLIHAAVITPGNPGAGNDVYANLSAAYASANNGDTVNLRAWSGTYIMTGNITTTKFVSLVGPGSSILIIKRSESSTDAQLETWESMIRYNINSNRPSGIKITGICFKSRLPSLNSGTDGLSVGRDMAIRLDFVVDFEIYKCRFENFGNGAINVNHRDYLARGLIDRCQFYHNAKRNDGLGLGYGVVVQGEGKEWISYVNVGGPNFIFIEDCNFDYHRHSVASAGGALCVVRYDTCDHNIIGGPYIHCIDGHDARGPGNFANSTGARCFEVYNCYLRNSTDVDGVTPVGNGQAVTAMTEHCIGIFAGEAYIHDNIISGYRFGIGIDSDHASGPYPYIYQIGWFSAIRYGSTHTGTDYSHGDGDQWDWNNTVTIYNFSGGINGVAFYNYQPTYYVQDRDYHLIAKPGYNSFPYPHPRRS